MKMILLGAPGAGKGTQAEQLSRILGIPTISTGNILRSAVEQKTPVGLQAKHYMETGQLVPDEVIIGIVAERLANADCAGGYILDGVPRTIAQAKELDRAGIHMDYAISIEISDEAVMARMSGRRICDRCGSSYHLSAVPPKTEGICDSCGGNLVVRKDDTPEIIKERLNVYHEHTAPLIDYYRSQGNLYCVETKPTVKETTDAILSSLGLCYGSCGQRYIPCRAKPGNSGFKRPRQESK